MPEGRETLINCASEQLDDESKSLVIVETVEQIDTLDIPNTAAYCLVNLHSGEIQYYCKMRHLLYEYTNIRKPNYLAEAAEMQGLAIREYPDMIEIELPCLFPHRKQRLSSEYLTDPLYFLLDKYTDSHPIKKYTDCVVCFVHEYDRELPERRIRDYDNIKQKQILDVIAAFVLKDDNGTCCNSYNSSTLADEDKTRILIMSRDRFCTWLAEQSASPPPSQN